ncbi:ABC transporter substrate-binding protein [Alkalihalophilus pseudofirmus]|uniref:ABC transporter substrate-binding protein n=1 Tax=Alkalihalophilus pseudofirmus TaxID=79885 RepID=A0AAJ2NK16_ALKPS|nr:MULTISPECIES: ABC transporter substrate-binding protein [Alkalihalophilus]MDV2883972.1 ABC transporter substrate-binding protein [Alkalihalophilus pseudofirmus]MED1602479.1 ABC transporter substrate-binding protein [Alkalihalophilus marmarensis]
MKKQWLISGAVVLSMLLGACASGTTGGESGEGSSEGEEQVPEVSAGEEIINIGYTGPLSGPAAFYGENTVSGVRMAADEINEAGGFEVGGTTYKLNIVTYDDQYLPNEAATNARRLVQEHNTPVVFVPHSGGVFATQVFNEQEDFMIAAYTSEPEILNQGNELTLRIPPAYDQYPEPFVKYQQERFGTRLALLPTATQYGKDWTEELVPVWEEFGGEVVYDGEVDFGKDTDFFPIVTNALNQNPDVIFVGGPSEPTALLMKAARDLGFEGGFMVMDQAKFEEMDGVLGNFDDIEGAIGMLPIISSDAPGAESFITSFENELGRVPTAESAFNYQAMYVLVEAMKLAETVEDPQAIMAQMDAGVKALSDDKFVWHLTGVENNGFDWMASIAAIEDGEIVLIEE